ncbi:MAG: iron-containing alcohol dehydrogenase [Candidatus Gastranaerophilaceae bacterium]
MENFTYSIPTVINFGEGQISHLSELKQSGNKVLLVYGGGSIKKSGLYEKAVEVLKNAGLEIRELSGVEPNPKIQSVREGVKICKDEKIDMVLAVGGGSVIDCAKVVAAGALYQGDPWDLVLDGGKIKAALPVYSVLTLSATGSEMDEFAVISDMSKNEKWGTGSPLVKPVMSVLDPTYTFSVSKKQTAAGTADMMSHTFENYFTNVEGAYLQGRLCEAVLKTCIKYGPVAVREPENYEARANLMWAGSLAINGLLSYGSEVGWCVHPMEHELSAFYDITHGEGLAILTPVWMKFVLKKDPSKTKQLADYGRNVWNISGDDKTVAEKAIEKTEEFFFKTMEMPANLRAVGINEKTNFEIMAQKAAQGCEGCFVPLTKEDIISIFEQAF